MESGVIFEGLVSLKSERFENYMGKSGRGRWIRRTYLRSEIQDLLEGRYGRGRPGSCVR